MSERDPHLPSWGSRTGQPRPHPDPSQQPRQDGVSPSGAPRAGKRNMATRGPGRGMNPDGPGSGCWARPRGPLPGVRSVRSPWHRPGGRAGQNNRLAVASRAHKPAFMTHRPAQCHLVPEGTGQRPAGEDAAAHGLPRGPARPTPPRPAVLPTPSPEAPASRRRRPGLQGSTGCWWNAASGRQRSAGPRLGLLLRELPRGCCNGRSDSGTRNHTTPDSPRSGLRRGCVSPRAPGRRLPASSSFWRRPPSLA